MLGGRGHHPASCPRCHFPNRSCWAVEPGLSPSSGCGHKRPARWRGTRRAPPGTGCHSLNVVSSAHLRLPLPCPGPAAAGAPIPPGPGSQGGREAPASAVPTGDAERTKVREGTAPPSNAILETRLLSSILNSRVSGEEKMAPSGRSGEKQDDKSCFQTGRVNNGVKQGSAQAYSFRCFKTQTAGRVGPHRGRGTRPILRREGAEQSGGAARSREAEVQGAHAHRRSLRLRRNWRKRPLQDGGRGGRAAQTGAGAASFT